MKQRLLAANMALLVAACFALAACHNDDKPKNTECDILAAWVEGEQYGQYFFDAAQMRVDNIPSNVQEITFTVRSVADLPPLPVRFRLSDGATISPDNGSAQDFTSGPVSYVVTSEDDAWTRRYTVTFREPYSPTSLFSFEHVDSVPGSVFSSTSYHVFYEVDADGERRDVWASGNEGVAMVHADYSPADYPTRSVADGMSGRAVCLTTQDAGSLGRLFGKPIAAGNLFLGHFNVGEVMSNPLLTTEFGIPVTQRPVMVEGYYRYRPGDEYTDAQMHVVEGRTDEASIYAILYRNRDADGNPVQVTGQDVGSNPNIISRAEVASLPATDQWARFEMTFEGEAPDPALLQAQGYSMSIVFSSSKAGAAFEGAIGSTLLIDEVKVTYAAAE